jgi:large subunit ribosomal protein L16
MASKRFAQKQLTKRPFKLFPKGVTRTFSNKLFSNSFSSFNIITLYNFRFRKILKPTFVVLRSSQYGFITDRALESFRRVISPYFKKKSGVNSTALFFIRGFAYTPLTKKPSEVRMGGGKGSKLRAWVLPVYPGKTLFEIFFINKNLALQLFTKARKKLGVNTSITFR